MKDSIESIVSAVTERVLAVLEQSQDTVCPKDEGKPKYLYFGDALNLPQKWKLEAELLSETDYQKYGNILRYQRVVISEMDPVDLADISIARPTSVLARAVWEALLNGIEVLLMESALSHRRYSGHACPALYRMMEGHVNTLQTYGVRLISVDSPMLHMSQNTNQIAECVEREDLLLITEEIAKDLAVKAKELLVSKRCIITPAAMDVFKNMHTTLVRR